MQEKFFNILPPCFYRKDALVIETAGASLYSELISLLIPPEKTTLIFL